jgi:hypothetical protein
VTDRDDRESFEPVACIGHALLSEQHAMRASGVVIQPAHRATGLAESAKLKRSAGSRLLAVSTLPRMLDRSGSVK